MGRGRRRLAAGHGPPHPRRDCAAPLDEVRRAWVPIGGATGGRVGSDVLDLLERTVSTVWPVERDGVQLARAEADARW